MSISDPEDRDLALLGAARALGAAKQWDAVRKAALAITCNFDKATALYEISVQLASAGRRDESLSVLSEAELALSDVDEAWQKAELLCQIAQLLTEVDVPDHARNLWDQAISFARLGENSSDVQRSVDSSSVLREISERLAVLGEEDKAKDVARSIRSPGKRAGALEAIARITGSKAS